MKTRKKIAPIILTIGNLPLFVQQFRRHAATERVSMLRRAVVRQDGRQGAEVSVVAREADKVGTLRRGERSLGAGDRLLVVEQHFDQRLQLLEIDLAVRVALFSLRTRGEDLIAKAVGNSLNLVARQTHGFALQKPTVDYLMNLVGQGERITVYPTTRTRLERTRNFKLLRTDLNVTSRQQ